MRFMKKVAAICMAVLLAASFVGCGSKDEIIKVGKDEIPSLYSVVGERKISGTSSGISNGVSYVEKSYSSGVVTREDIDRYWDALRETGFAVTMEAESMGTRIVAQLGRQSVDEGKVVIVDLAFDSAGSTVLRYQVGTGTLTIY